MTYFHAGIVTLYTALKNIYTCHSMYSALHYAWCMACKVDPVVTYKIEVGPML